MESGVSMKQKSLICFCRVVGTTTLPQVGQYDILNILCTLSPWKCVSCEALIAIFNPHFRLPPELLLAAASVVDIKTQIKIL